MTILSPDPYRFLGSVTDVHFAGPQLDLQCGAAAVRIEVLDANLLRVRLAPQGQFDHGFSYAVAQSAWPPVETTLHTGDNVLELHTPSLVCRVQKSPCRISFYDSMNRLLAQDEDGLGWNEAGATICRWRSLVGAHFYGLGEKAFPMERRGRRLTLYNTDPGFYKPFEDPIYQSFPVFLALVPALSVDLPVRAGDAMAYALFLDNPARSVFDLAHEQPDVLSFGAETGELRYYFMAAPKLADVLQTYTQLTGRMALPPLWALGYHQARWSYPDEATVRDLAEQFRRRRIPCDAIYLDIDYMEGYRCFTWDKAAFPDPRGMIADLRGQGIKTVAIIDAGVKVDAESGYAVHDDGVARDVFLCTADGKRFVAPVWPGDCYFPDFTSPSARTWWGELYQGLLDDGVAGFWNDMNEPALFDGHVLPADAPFDYEGHGAAHRAVHNVYGMQMARATADGLARLRPNDRHLVISRSAFCGHQRHAMVWTGDNYSTWEHLRLTIAMGLSLGLSGMAFHGADVGGFAGDCDGELLARWTQLAALTPFFRNHAAMGTVNQEPWMFGEKVEAICRRAIELRYELLPAIYTAFWQASQTGTPVMRALVLSYQYDARTAAIDDQFLLGNDLLAAPVLEPGSHGRQVYLPVGQWVDFWTGQRYSGGMDHWTYAPLDRLPLFVKGGSVLPMQPVQQHTDEPPADTITLRVYPGVGESLWYEDDGRSLAYQQGEFRLTRFAVRGDEDWMQCQISHEGVFISPRRSWRWQVIGLARCPDTVEVDDQLVSDWEYDDATRELRLTTPPCGKLAVR